MQYSQRRRNPQQAIIGFGRPEVICSSLRELHRSRYRREVSRMLTDHYPFHRPIKSFGAILPSRPNYALICQKHRGRGRSTVSEVVNLEPLHPTLRLVMQTINRKQSCHRDVEKLQCNAPNLISDRCRGSGTVTEVSRMLTDLDQLHCSVQRTATARRCRQEFNSQSVFAVQRSATFPLR